MWKRIPGTDYEASSRGQVRNTRTGKVLTPMWTGAKAIRQYATVVLHGRQVKVHRAVLLAFRGAPPKGNPYGLHRDDDTTNNRLSNLFWGTALENARAATQRKDQKVSAAQRAKIRKCRAAGLTYREIGQEFGISAPRAHEVCNTHWELDSG